MSANTDPRPAAIAESLESLHRMRERDRLNDAVADAVAAVVYAIEELDDNASNPNRSEIQDELLSACRALKRAYDERAEFIGRQK